MSSKKLPIAEKILSSDALRNAVCAVAERVGHAAQLVKLDKVGRAVVAQDHVQQLARHCKKFERVSLAFHLFALHLLAHFGRGATTSTTTSGSQAAPGHSG